MCDYIKAETLKFLSLSLYETLEKEKETTCTQFSDHYFTGEYPIKPRITWEN